jgi:Zn-dependent peptidase ImmA (M78 family)/transcriptional regulator with XRE-family HTH domain
MPFINNFNASMLVLARDYRMLTQKDVSTNTRIPQTALSRYESGISIPDEDSIKALSVVLKFPVSFFCNNSRVYPPATPFHRKKITVAKKIVDSAEALGNIQRIQVNNMLSQLDSITNDVPSIPIDGDDAQADSATKVAQYTRRSFGLPRGPIDNLTGLLEEHGVIISFARFASEKIDGFTLRGGLGEHPIVFLNNVFQAEKDRMTLSHELGHIVMHQTPTETCEDEAWEFASEFLMPAEEIIQELPKNLTRIRQLIPLKKRWKVSMKALVKRSLDLGVIKERTAVYLYKQLAPYGKFEPLPIGKETPTLIKALLEYYQDDLQYSRKELLDFLGIEPELFDEWYGDDIKTRRFSFS